MTSRLCSDACRRCSCAFERKSNRQKFCASCQPVERKERIRRWQRSKAAEMKTHAAPVMRSCERCDTSFEVQRRNRKLCDACRVVASRENQARHYWKNADAVRERVRERSRRDGEAIRLRKAKARALNPAPAAEYNRSDRGRSAKARWKQRKSNDPSYRIRVRISKAMRNSMREKKAGRTWETLVGYSLSDLCRHLERQFLPGMSWSNLDQWHIDHIIPVSSFDLSDVDDENFAACFALTNLRPLWARDNLKKHSKRLLLI